MVACYVNVRESVQVRNADVLTATGITPNGERQVIGVSVSLNEHENQWKTFLMRLQECGMHDLQLVISDDHEGMGATR